MVRVGRVSVAQHSDRSRSLMAELLLRISILRGDHAARQVVVMESKERRVYKATHVTVRFGRNS